MTLFNGDNKNTTVTGTINGKNFYWKIDTGSAVTCMNINAFQAAFGKTRKERQKEFKTDIFVKNRKCAHTVQIADKWSENILDIDLLQKFRLHLNPKTGNVTFLSKLSSALFATKKFHTASFCNNSSASQNFPNHRQQAQLHCQHWGTKTALDIRTLNLSQFRLSEAVHSANTKLCPAGSQYQHRRHFGHIGHRRGHSNSLQR